MPEIQIQDLLDTINRDGVEKAQKKADGIVQQALRESKDIIHDAQKRAEVIVEDAIKERDNYILQGEAALKQAAGNVCISLKNELNDMIKKIVTRKLSDQLNSDVVSQLILQSLKEIPSKNIILELSNKTLEFCKGALADEISNGLEIRVNDSMKTGFRLEEKNGSGYYDFSQEELVNLIMPYLSNSLKSALKG